MNKKIFRAYDIRGVYGKDFTDRDAVAIGRACARLFRPIRRISLVIGRDARLSSPALYRALIAGLNTLHVSRFTIHAAGLITTPMLAFLVNTLNADGGIMITASHNPKEWNGFKIVGRKGVPIGGEDIKKLVASG